MWQNYFSVTSIDEALFYLAKGRGHARIIAGATDLVIEIERGIRKGIDTLIDITRIPGLDQIDRDDDDMIHLGPLVTHNQCAASSLIQERAFPLARAAWEVGAPQIRNRATVAGNLITASPANDTIPPLLALDARLRLVRIGSERVVPLSEFYTGVRHTVMEPDEIVTDIFFPAMKSNQRGTFIKLGLRNAQAISVVNAAVLLTFQGTSSEDKASALIFQQPVAKASISLGSVAPTVIHANSAEEYLAGCQLSEEVIRKAAELAEQAAHPISDIRSSAAYRQEMIRICVARALQRISTGEEKSGFSQSPVMLSDLRKSSFLPETVHHDKDSAIETTINGKAYSFLGGYDKNLLRLIREDAGLTGTKEGCAEGECGACTVFLDGKAVMSCLVPAARAHHAEIVTIEGLAVFGDHPDRSLHPVQQAFIEHGAVQCGYCTPGFIMAAAMLLDEKEHPEHGDILQAISGNLCRCTGYYKIIEAIESTVHQLQP